jgi:hypothetical protein
VKGLFQICLIVMFTVFIFTSDMRAGGLESKPADGRVELPLSSGDCKEIRKSINPNLVLIVYPEEDGWDVEVVKKSPTDPGYNLLYHSDQWHGPYPTQVYAWQIAEDYFGNSRWLCVQGYPVEVHILLLDPKVVKKGDEFVFQSGRLIVEWYKRPCTHPF